MEAYRTDDATCRSGVLSFMSAWTARLHDLGYLSRFYSSMGSGVADQVANYSDYVDFALLPPAQLADFTGNGWSDLLARTTSNGNLVLYPGNGTYVDTGGAVTVGTGGWNAMSAILRIGDLDRDGHEDLIDLAPPPQLLR
jgi:hypothetical protein